MQAPLPARSPPAGGPLEDMVPTGESPGIPGRDIRGGWRRDRGICDGCPSIKEGKNPGYGLMGIDGSSQDAGCRGHPGGWETGRERSMKKSQLYRNWNYEFIRIGGYHG